MGPKTTMNTSNSSSTILAIPKLCNDGSHWADYQPRLQNVMGLKEFWRHVEKTATVSVPFATNNGIPMLNDRKMLAMEDQIESKETKILEFEKREYLA